MKLSRISLALLLTVAFSSFSVSAKAIDPSVTISGVTFSWPENIYSPVLMSSVPFVVTNRSGYRIAQAQYVLTDKFGSRIQGDSAIGLFNNVTTTLNSTWYAIPANTYSEPYKLTFSVEFLISDGIGNPAPVSRDFKFTERTVAQPTPTPTVTVTAKPTPAPTVTVTAKPVQEITDWALMESLKAEVAIAKNELKAVKAKLKKICSAKPKPKGC
jgi:hypothetical protein